MAKYYKGFNKDMTCRGFQYEEGKTYHEDSAKLCESGFHACENPLDCFEYYAPNNAVYHEVELEDVCEERGDDSKVVAKTIKVGAELTVADICKAHFEFTRSNCKEAKGSTAKDHEYLSGGDCSSLSGGRCSSLSGGGYSSLSGGYRSSLSGGYRSSLSGGYGSSLSGGYGSSLSGGDYSSLSGGYRSSLSGGYRSSLSGGDDSSLSGGRCSSLSGGDDSSLSGGYGSSLSGGENSAMCARAGKARGGINACICLTETDDYGNNISCACALVDGVNIKENTWYICKDGKLVECEEPK